MYFSLISQNRIRTWKENWKVALQVVFAEFSSFYRNFYILDILFDSGITRKK
jgi:hypothetical protein